MSTSFLALCRKLGVSPEGGAAQTTEWAERMSELTQLATRAGVDLFSENVEESRRFVTEALACRTPQDMMALQARWIAAASRRNLETFGRLTEMTRTMLARAAAPAPQPASPAPMPVAAPVPAPRAESPPPAAPVAAPTTQPPAVAEVVAAAPAETPAVIEPPAPPPAEPPPAVEAAAEVVTAAPAETAAIVEPAPAVEAEVVTATAAPEPAPPGLPEPQSAPRNGRNRKGADGQKNGRNRKKAADASAGDETAPP